MNGRCSVIRQGRSDSASEIDGAEAGDRRGRGARAIASTVAIISATRSAMSVLRPDLEVRLVDDLEARHPARVARHSASTKRAQGLYGPWPESRHPPLRRLCRGSGPRVVDPARVAIGHQDHLQPVGDGGVDLRVERGRCGRPGLAGSSSATRRRLHERPVDPEAHVRRARDQRRRPRLGAQHRVVLRRRPGARSALRREVDPAAHRARRAAAPAASPRARPRAGPARRRRRRRAPRVASGACAHGSSAVRRCRRDRRGRRDAPPSPRDARHQAAAAAARRSRARSRRGSAAARRRRSGPSALAEQRRCRARRRRPGSRT